MSEHSTDSAWIWGDREPAFAAARELVTLFKMAEEQGLDNDSHRGGAVREITRGWLPWQRNLLIEVLARGVASTFTDLGEWSDHVLAALDDAEADDA